jgi:glycogen operon protein
MSSSSQTGEIQIGLTFGARGGTIAVYSANATEVLCNVLDPNDFRTVIKSIKLARGENDIWSATDKLLVPGVKYAIRAAGPNGPRDGFNETLNLIDPYAKGVIRESARDYVNVGIDDSFDWQDVQKPKISLAETIIYEAHLRGLTRLNPEIPDDLRGTYAALGHPSTIEHLTKLGVTSVELLPIHMFISEPRLMNMGLINYWGYNTINFFSPHPRYATAVSRESGPQAIVNEFKTAIRELHRAGIEVLLDVVYNHTAEGGNRGLTYSFRGLDNSAYYRQDENGNFHDTTGCGNSLDFSNPRVVQLTMDSLRYWTEEMQVDGFRFDLAATLARDASNQFDPNHPLLQQMVADPILADAKLIVEPWDVGLGGWQTGNFPDRMPEWNDRYRDSVRRFWLSDIGDARYSGKHNNGIADIATRLAGSRDVVDGPHGPLGAINFVTAHDGFTLHDLAAYNVKHNQGNGESNRDGSSNNHSFNHGIEGDTTDQQIATTRRKAVRNLMGTLLLSAGVPMITAGDERGKTQMGNNNAYCQDSVLSWVHWDTTRQQADLEATTAYLIKLRKEHPALRPANFGSFDELKPGLDRIRWYNRFGEIMTDDDWNNAERRTIQRVTEHVQEDGSLCVLLTIIHGSEDVREVNLPKLDGYTKAELLWNSAHELPPASIDVFDMSAPVTMSATSMMLFHLV